MENLCKPFYDQNNIAISGKKNCTFKHGLMKLRSKNKKMNNENELSKRTLIIERTFNTPVKVVHPTTEYCRQQ